MFNAFIVILATLLGFGADVITVTGGSAGSAGSTAAELITYMSAKTLDVAVTNTVLNQFGDKQPLPAGASKTIRFTRFEKFATSATPTQLTEGVTPDAVGATINQVEATVEQYGLVVRIADLAELTARHPLVQQCLNRMGLHAAETYDQLIFNVLDAATNNYRPNGKAGDSNLTPSDQVTYNDFVALQATLMDSAARPVQGQNYVMVVPPQVAASLQKDPDWKSSHQLAQPEAIWNGQIGRLANFDVVVSNAPAFAATTQASPSGSANKVYSFFAIGRDSYQITDLQSLEVIVTPPGGQSDPLKQNYKLGYKFSMKAVISNQNWIRRGRAAGANSVAN
jgi:N4-gp56 family major capsid protein